MSARQRQLLTVSGPDPNNVRLKQRKYMEQRKHRSFFLKMNVKELQHPLSHGAYIVCTYSPRIREFSK